ncbi:MAG TPA: 16S rRNA (guanine(527)-N(7))-methyltransferase RsmG [Bacteroidales bacterium]|nr:16S rRNA (guanine(527)-N(7))-methyltransferase RsmG [Bacteroidales bacterium]
MELIKKYFPGLTETQLSQFAHLEPLYNDWNSKINVISRKDMEHFYLHHVLHSLAIAKTFTFTSGMRILDVGTGGGFPGIPLAILFPETNFTLVDSIGKKITVVKEVASAIGLKNVEAFQTRAEDMKGQWDIVVSRAVTELPKFMTLVRNRLNRKPAGNQPKVIYLKGGDVENELTDLRMPYTITNIDGFFTEEFFSTKLVVKIF